MITKSCCQLRSGLVAVTVISTTHADDNHNVFMISTVMTFTTLPQCNETSVWINSNVLQYDALGLESRQEPKVTSMLSFYEKLSSMSVTEDITNLINEHKDVFVEHSGLGKVTSTEHMIVTHTETPIRSAP